MTRWTIDGRGDTGTKAIHYSKGKRYVYNVCRLSGGFWLAECEFMDGSILQLNASEMTSAGAQARCEFDAVSK
jgi:hypothetical protein